VMNAPGPVKYIVCNADEGEPGTCKDRLLMQNDPHQLIEGLVIAAEADGLDDRLAFLGDILGHLRALDAEVDLHGR